MESNAKVEKYILLLNIHLGNIKDTFGRGAVIEYNPINRAVRIDGRICENGAKDIELLKSQAMKNPHKPWICQWSEEALEDIRGASDAAPAVPHHVPKHKMEIVQSDEDSYQTIDISHTQVSKINQAKKEAERNRKKSGDMPIIQGQQSVEDRIAELSGKKDSDLSSRAEKVRLMQSKKADMPIVRDDSLGAGVGTGSSSSMNAGGLVGGRRANEVPEYVSNSADARKQEIENNRKVAAQDEFGFDIDQAGIDEIVPSPDEFKEEVVSTTADIEIELTEQSKDDEIAALKAQVAAMSAGQKPIPPEKEMTAQEVVRTPTKVETEIKKTPVMKEN